jgi:hypothetical protein
MAGVILNHEKVRRCMETQRIYSKGRRCEDTQEECLVTLEVKTRDRA